MKNLTTTLLLLLSMTIFSSEVIAQKSKESLSRKEKRALKKKKKALKKFNQTKYFEVGVGAVWGATQDLAMSNQVYEGFGAQLVLDGLLFTPKSIREFDMSGGVNLGTSQGGITGYDIPLRTSYAYQFIVQDLDKHKWRIAVGPQAEILGQMRIFSSLGNSGFNWDGVGSVGASFRIDRDWTVPFIKKEIGIYGRIYLPLVAYVNRPNYGVTTWDLPNQTVTTLGNFFRATTEIGYAMPVSKGSDNLFSVNYRWDMFRFRDNEVYKVVTGHHSLNLTLMVKMR
jgi:hypothetical protein